MTESEYLRIFEENLEDLLWEGLDCYEMKERIDNGNCPFLDKCSPSLCNFLVIGFWKRLIRKVMRYPVMNGWSCRRYGPVKAHIPCPHGSVWARQSQYWHDHRLEFELRENMKYIVEKLEKRQN